MTDATAGRGGVGIRLFVSGGEVVRRTFDQIGDSGRKMWSEVALGQKSANPAIRALSLGVGEAKSGIEGFAGRAGSAGVALGAFGAAGVAATVVLAGIAVGLNKAREAMSFADEIDDAATKLAIGTTALQQYRYAMISVGGSAEDADAAIESFTEKLGEAQAGGRALKWFEKIGFTREQLKGYDTAEAALGDVIDRLAGLNKETERQAVSSKIGLGSMAALTREGQDGVEALMQAALDLGYVMDEELVKNGAEANRKFEEMSTIIDVQMKSAFVSLAPVILELAGFFVYLAQTIADVADSWRDLDDRSTRGLQRQDAALAAQQMQLLRGKSSPAELTGYGRQAWDRINASRGQIAGQLAGRGPEAASERPDQLIDTPDRARTGRSSRVSGEARAEEQRQRERERALDDLQKQELDAQREALRAKYGPGGFGENATELALATVQIEQQANWAAIVALEERLKISGALSEEAQLRVDALKAGHDELGKVKDTAILLEERRMLAADRLEDEVGADEAAIDLLSIQEQMATTARERFEIGRRILLAEQELERNILEAEVNENGGVTPYEQNELDRQAQRHAAQTSLFEANEQNRLRENFRNYGREVVDAIESGRIGETIGEEIKARLLDGALDQLFNLMNGGASGKSGGGGFLGTVLSVGAGLIGGGNPAGIGKAGSFGKGGGRAGGGDVRDGFAYDIVEGDRPELLMIGGKGHVTSAAETARMVRDMAGSDRTPGSSSPAPQVIMPPITINAQGADAAGLARVERAVDELNRSLEPRAVGAVREAQARRIL